MLHSLTKRFYLVALTILLTSVAYVGAQPEQCSTLVNDAITEANAQCGGLARNEVCYGARSVRASFSGITDTSAFSAPSDIVDVINLTEIAAAPLNLDTQQVGVALMRLQANIPNTLPGQAVVLVLVGDVSLKSDIQPDAAFVPVDPIAITVERDDMLFAGPAETFNTVEMVLAGTTLAADGFSEDNTMMRVVTETGVAWIKVEAVTSATDLRDALPVITATSYGAMQAFTLTGGVGEARCSDAPDALMVQTPRGNPVTLRINGTDVTVSSTVVFRPGDNRMELAVLDGRAELASGEQVLPGFQTGIALDPITNLVDPLEEWEAFKLFDEDLENDFEVFEALANDIVNYLIDEPDAAYLQTIETLLSDPDIDYVDLFALDADGDGVLDFEEELEAQIDALNGEIEALQGEIDGAIGDLEDALGEIDGAIGELDGLLGSDEIDDITGELDQALNDVDEAIGQLEGLFGGG